MGTLLHEGRRRWWCARTTARHLDTAAGLRASVESPEIELHAGPMGLRGVVEHESVQPALVGRRSTVLDEEGQCLQRLYSLVVKKSIPSFEFVQFLVISSRQDG